MDADSTSNDLKLKLMKLTTQDSAFHPGIYRLAKKYIDSQDYNN